jgi:hypothetical protein
MGKMLFVVVGTCFKIHVAIRKADSHLSLEIKFDRLFTPLEIKFDRLFTPAILL